MAIWNRKSSSSDGASPHASDPEYGTKPEYQHETGEVSAVDSNGVAIHSDHAHLHRGLKSRHITMIAIGGAIGTGLIIGTGKALAQSGPGSILIAYTSVGLIVYVVMTALGEMAAWIPHASGFAGYATRFCDPALGFALGWTYWCKYIITTPNQLTATALILSEWKSREEVNPGVWIAIFLVAIICINYFGIKFFGELEFWLSSIKVITIVGVIFLSFLLAVGAGPGGATGFKYYEDPGAFKPYITTGSAGKFYGFWSSLVNAVFAYLGTELIGVTVGEAQNPRKTIPRAIKLTFYRILFFYCLSVFFLGMIVPYDSEELAFANKATTGASASPFVVAIKLAKIPALPTIVNACILLFTFSASNSDLYIASRTIYGLAVEGHAPKIFLWTDKRGVPVPALAISALFCCTAFMNAADDAKVVFGYFVNLTTIFGLLSWISLLVSHIWFVRARRAQGITKDMMAYTAPFGLTGSYIALFFCILIALTKNFNVFTKSPKTYGDFDYKNFVTGYLGIPVYLICIFGYKIIMKSKMVKPHEADFYSGKAEIDREEEAFLAHAAEKRATEGKGGSWFYRTFVAWLI
ncbi:amino acid permease/ SLC12A domain-containing protein [Alternaria rosae]|uniref:amino acid permease/ SLC12A domain-containing protein n=1 Tax=Alternaria rosae TaxID=1187941 RepID=UPI001E8EC540|nr:amino acid permease/ SLC12A domain-containing protein [Alternaria rosae]KAH6882044.1 amino acid permease/ SLC12A domain-containing protein [Alternaria rosae]